MLIQERIHDLQKFLDARLRAHGATDADLVRPDGYTPLSEVATEGLRRACWNLGAALTHQERGILAPCSSARVADDVDGRTIFNLFESVALFPSGQPKILEELLPFVSAWRDVAA